MNGGPQPGWYPDHADPRYVRWWDGFQWTPHVQPAQRQPQPAQQHPNRGDAHEVELQVGGTGRQQVQQQVQRAGIGGPVGGGGTLFSEPVLVVNQKAKLMELANEYVIYDQHARQIGSVMQVGQSGAQKVLRAFTKLDSALTIKLEVRDAYGMPVLRLTRPATMWKSKVLVERADGFPIGEIRQENAFGKVRFAFEVGGQRVGGILAENFRAWNFAVQDHAGAEVGRITKTWQGFGKAVFTNADNYVVQLHRPLADPLLSMVVASGITVDTVLSQVRG
ncbi:MAG TPA: phospholipid scramblase-related protein [Pseudonocardiaceae bacterium]|nr:phospholipid scramblase-related protein [Pseudonocardiaceae bacterium]